MSTDTRLPAVYINVNDTSYSEDAADCDRSGYVVIVSDRGPHNVVVELNTTSDLHNIFGEPNFTKYGHGHQIADRFLQYSSKLYVVRVAMMEATGDATNDDCMSIAHAFLVENDPNDANEVEGSFVFTNGTNVVTVDDSTSYASISVSQWIYPSGGDPENARQVVEKSTDDGYEFILDDDYEGETTTDTIKVFQYFSITKQSALRDTDFDTLDVDTLWYFYAIGAGSYYNNLFIKGVRNTQYERMYVDDDGNALYPYNFMDIGVYSYDSDDDTYSMEEGPWTVSLTNKTGNGSATITDIYSGEELYLPTVINANSALIRVEEGGNTSALMTTSSETVFPYEPDVNRRLMIQALFADTNVFGVDTLANTEETTIDGGFFLKNGDDGCLFTSSDLLNLTEEYEGLIAQAYAGTLDSPDGTVANILQAIYPKYQFDYVLCGGYSYEIAYYAKVLVDTRQDCLLLADTGANYNSADKDIAARASKVPWNTQNAMLYTQYRKITDVYTGKKIWVSPVVHAIECHLSTDSEYWVSEPVAGVEKGAIEESCELAYSPTLTKLGDMTEVELNPVIIEPDGTYILTQYTTWKQLSIMRRAHVVKFVHYCQKKLPTILKDLLQRKASQWWLSQAEQRVAGFMEQFVDVGDSSDYASITSYTAAIDFDTTRSELNIELEIVPLRAIEKIFLTINVS